MTEPKIEWKKYGDEFIVLLNDNPLGTSSRIQMFEVNLNSNGYEVVKDFKLHELNNNLISLFQLKDFKQLNDNSNISPFKITYFSLHRENGSKDAELNWNISFDFGNWILPLSPNQISDLFLDNIAKNKNFFCELIQDSMDQGLLYEIAIKYQFETEKTIGGKFPTKFSNNKRFSF